MSGISAGIFTGTATAALVDLAGKRGTGHASLVATAVNMGGIGGGRLLAGVRAVSPPLRCSCRTPSTSCCWSPSRPASGSCRSRWR